MKHHTENVNLAVRGKRGRDRLNVAKIVSLRGEAILAMAYRNRPTTNFVSLPQSALTLAQGRGVKRWIVRHDREAVCLEILLVDVDGRGILKTSAGRPEIFLPLTAFHPCPWVDWPFVPSDAVVWLDVAPDSRQPFLLGAD